jgi:DnaJ-domain-containing protein 1
MIDAYPLAWPVGWPREHSPQYSSFRTPLEAARDQLFRELELLGATDVVISSNAEVSKTGYILVRQRRIDDTGVAVYFTLNGAQRCIPCDKWVLLADNVHAIELTVNALRGLERWGAKEMVNAAFAGFEALPESTHRPWHTVLGLSPEAANEEIDRAYKRLAKRLHPDLGGSAAAFHELQDAYQAAKQR